MRTRPPPFIAGAVLAALALMLATPAGAEEPVASSGSILALGRERPGWAGGPSAQPGQGTGALWTGFLRAAPLLAVAAASPSPPAPAAEPLARAVTAAAPRPLVPPQAPATDPPAADPPATEPPGRVRAEIVVDLATGQVLHERNADAPARPASLAKLMTLDLLFSAIEAGALDEAMPIPLSARAAAMPATRLGLPAGSSITAREAALCLAVHSCNDVAAAVAERLAGDEERFAAAMTDAAQRLGLRATSFGNASGLPDPRNRSTARDLALLGAWMAARHARWQPILGTAHWSHGGASFRNTARLIGTHPLIQWGKTGYVRASGYNMLAVAATPDGRRVVVVVLGGAAASERDGRVAALVEAGLAGARRPVTAVRRASL